ncbi:MAG: hypothetical protein ACK4OJ_00255 [Brevundimonas sp.]
MADYDWIDSQPARVRGAALRIIQHQQQAALARLHELDIQRDALKAYARH